MVGKNNGTMNVKRWIKTAGERQRNEEGDGRIKGKASRRER